MMEQIKMQETESQPKGLKNFFIELFDLVSFLVFVGGIVLFVRFFVFNPYTVVGQSMEPTFDEKDFIIVDKITPKLNHFKRGDVIVFVPQGKEVPYIKRVVGLPGEVVKLMDDKVFVCNSSMSGDSCTQMNEPYLSKDDVTKAACGVSEFVVTSGSYFVLGDNRQHSTDSRCCFGLGCYSGASYLVQENNIIGKVYVRIFPNFEKF